MNIIKRFWSKVDIRGENECWLWKATLSQDGYGKFKYKGKMVKTHRMAYSLVTGLPLDELRVVRHKCDNPPCCNTKHLEEGTVADNNRDKIIKGREPNLKGEHNGRAKLTEHQIIDIRIRYAKGESQGVIAKDYGIARNTISYIVNGKSWSHISGIRIGDNYK